MSIVATASVPERSRALRPAPSEATVDLQRTKVANGKPALYGVPVVADGGCPSWCRGGCSPHGAAIEWARDMTAEPTEVVAERYGLSESDATRVQDAVSDLLGQALAHAEFDDDGAQLHRSDARVVGASLDNATHLFHIEVQRLDFPGSPVTEAFACVDGVPMTLDQALDLADALRATVMQARGGTVAQEVQFRDRPA